MGGRAWLVAVAMLVACAPAAHASSIVYQCGGAVCAVDPDTGAAPVTLGSGRVAGVTRDGTTAAWVVSPSAIVEAPIAGGAPHTLYAGEIYDWPEISPDGAEALWSWYFGGYGWYTYRAAGGAATTIASSTYQTTHGWLGATPLVVFRGSADGTTKSQICASVAGGPSCDTLIAADPSLQVAFPNGSPDGAAVVALRAPIPSSFGAPVTGAIALYSTATHTLVRELTSGPDDTHPRFSADGTRVVFERAGGIYVVDTAGGAPRKVADGATPFWGGATTEPPPGAEPNPTPTPTPAPGPGPAPGGPGPTSGAAPAPSPKAVAPKLVGKATPRNLAGRKLKATVHCAAACRVQLTLTVTRSLAKTLGLGKATALATASGRRSSAGALTLTLKPAAKATARLKRRSSLSATLRVKLTPGGTVIKTIRLKR